MKAIHAEPMPIKTILQNYEFVIPEYQRPYSWEKDQCAQLWEDLEAFLGGDENRYFLGSIVVCPSPQAEGAVPNEKVLSVIDGQQRLTTLLLLLKTMLNRVGTMSIIGKMIYKLDSLSGDPMKSMEPSLESNVQPGDGRDDRADFYQIMAGKPESMDRKNLFKVNYQCLQEAVDEWLKGRGDARQLESDIGRLLDKVTMLLIRCDSEKDALILFQTINDRGMPLSDADIFKAKIYNVVDTKKRDDFIARWNDMDNHDVLFRIFMQISRARGKVVGNEIALRRYMEEEHLNDASSLAKNWERITDSLERCHWARTSKDKFVMGGETDEAIYKGVLHQCPHMHWEYPLSVYLHKHAEFANNAFYIHPDKKDEYIALMKNTIRYFFIKGVVYGSIYAVRDTASRVCAAIQHDGDYVGAYEDSIADGKNDLVELDKKLNESDCGRFRKGLVVLAALLNGKQNRAEFADFLGKRYDIEHILPRRWRDYDGWDKKSHKAHIGSIGNLVPLEMEINRGVGNEWFPYKKKRYEGSSVQDAKDLRNLSHWASRGCQKATERVRRPLVEILQRI